MRKLNGKGPFIILGGVCFYPLMPMGVHKALSGRNGVYFPISLHSELKSQVLCWMLDLALMKFYSNSLPILSIH